MDPKRFDDSLTHKIRRHGRSRLHAPSLDEVDAALKTLGDYTTELKDVVRELFLAIGSRAKADEGPRQV